jgi:hypothetical protein
MGADVPEGVLRGLEVVGVQGLGEVGADQPQRAVAQGALGGGTGPQDGSGRIEQDDGFADAVGKSGPPIRVAGPKPGRLVLLVDDGVALR